MTFDAKWTRFVRMWRNTMRLVRLPGPLREREVTSTSLADMAYSTIVGPILLGWGSS